MDTPIPGTNTDQQQAAVQVQAPASAEPVTVQAAGPITFQQVETTLLSRNPPLFPVVLACVVLATLIAWGSYLLYQTISLHNPQAADILGKAALFLAGVLVPSPAVAALKRP